MRAKALGLLTNLLIDLCLPEAAAKAVEAHERLSEQELSSVQTQTTLSENEFKRLDWKARIAFRNGEWEKAIYLMGRKRALNPDVPARETAWLLYFHAWKHHRQGLTDPSAAQKWRDEAIALLTARASHPIGEGNDDTVYLLRALACWAALMHDKTDLEVVCRWSEIIESRVSAIDPGPWAFVVLYLALAGDSWGRKLQEQAFAALETSGYFLEAAAFAARCHRTDLAPRYLERFYRHRDLALEHLSGLDWLGVTTAAPVDPATVVPM